MAIDTALKRGSTIGTKLPFRMTLPFPSGTIGAAQRAMIGTAYAGIPFSPPNPPPTNLPYVLGTCMVMQGTTIYNQGTTPLINKGLVRDQRNIIPH